MIDEAPQTDYPMTVIARVRSDFKQKFGVPRQSGLVPDLRATIVFEPEFRNSDAVAGLDGFSHLWLIWAFSQTLRDEWNPTVRPPRLQGERIGVFATRSPHRPNPLGLSSVIIEEITEDPAMGPVITVLGADLVDGTPIFDIKPYIATDSHPEASFGFTSQHTDYRLQVDFPEELQHRIPTEKVAGLVGALAEDPRPHYHRDAARRYGLSYAGFDVKFLVEGNTLTVIDIE